MFIVLLGDFFLTDNLNMDELIDDWSIEWLIYMFLSELSCLTTTEDSCFYRIKVQIRVQDDNGSATLSLFGQDVCKIIGKSQAYLMQKIDKFV